MTRLVALTTVLHYRADCEIKNLVKVGSQRGHELLLKFSDPFISRERFVLETSDLACRLTTRVTNEKNAKLGQRGRQVVT